MPDTFTANFDFTQPEVGGSDETWGDKLNANWGALDTLLREIRLSMVGQVSGFAATSAPDGWLKCDGQAVSRTTYEDLWDHAQASGNLAATEGGKLSGEFGPGDGSTTFTLPDYRGKFLRAWDDSAGVDSGRGIGTEQDNQNKSHNHGGSTGNAGGHNHGGSTGNAGGHNHGGSTGNAGAHSHTGSTGTAGNHSHSGSTASGGGHSHNITGASSPGSTLNPRRPIIDYATDSLTATTASAGAHSHSLNINSNGAHTHSVSISSQSSHSHSISSESAHSHSISSESAHSHSISSEGGSEARPTNNAYLVCIKH